MRMFKCRLNAEYQREQDRQEQKRLDDVKAREAKSRKAFEVKPFATADRCELHQNVMCTQMFTMAVATNSCIE